MAPRCSVFGCSSRGPKGVITKRYYFPKDKTLRDKWIHLCGIHYEISDKHRVCGKHFSRKQRRSLEEIRNSPKTEKRVLKLDAVPDINLPDIGVRSNINEMRHYTRCVPLSVKLKILDDQEKGIGPKKIMAKYKVKKSAYYRILSERDSIREYVDKGGSLDLVPKKEKEDHEDIDTIGTIENSEHKDKENSDTEDLDSSYSESSTAIKGMRVLRIQDQITAFQRIQAGETAGRIASDMGVSRQTINRVKKRLKDTLFTPAVEPQYQASADSMSVKDQSEEYLDEDMDNKDGVLAVTERRKQLRDNNILIPKKDRSLTYAEKIEAVKQCKAGIPLKTIAHNFAVSSSTIQRVKKQFSQSHQLPFKNYMRLEDKVRILERLDEGETFMEIAEDLGLHESSIRAVKKNRIKIMSLFRLAGRKLPIMTPPSTPSSEDLSRKTKPNQYITMERKLLAWINDLKSLNIPMSAAMIQKKALMIQMNLPQDECEASQSFLPTKEWLSDFKRRNNIGKFSQDDSDTESEQDEIRYTKAAPKSKKKFFAVRRSDETRHKEETPPPPHSVEKIPFSKFAEGLREMYLTRSLPPNKYRCNAFTPRVLLSSLEPRHNERHISNDIVKIEPVSDEETWLTGHANVASDSDWTELNWDANSLTEASVRSQESPKKKRKNVNGDFREKRRRMEDDMSDGEGSVASYNRPNFINVSIKQEPQSTMDSLAPNMPMAVLPAGSTYVPPLPMFQMPGAGITMFMPESQQMMMQHSLNFPHNSASDLFMNQQLRDQTIDSNGTVPFNNIPGEVSAEPSIAEDEDMVTMPFGNDADDDDDVDEHEEPTNHVSPRVQDQEAATNHVSPSVDEEERANHLPPSEPDSVSDALAEKARKEREAAIAENIGLDVEGSSQKKLQDLTVKLLELNNKNLKCDERIKKAKEEYDKIVANIEGEKKRNDMEIDKVLSAIQQWKEAKGTTNV